MTWLDYAVLGVLVVSLGWSALRGVVREIFSLAGWVMAFLAASLFAGPLAGALPPAIPGEALRVLVAYAAVFVAVLVVSGLTGWLLSKLVKIAGLGAVDHLLGALFGIVRGALLVLVFALMAGLTSLPRHSVWRDSVTGGPLTAAALALRPWLPESFAGRLRYD